MPLFTKLFKEDICFIASVHEFQIKACHLEGVKNRISDSLSRWHLNIKYKEELNKLIDTVYYEDVHVEENLFYLSHDW